MKLGSVCRAYQAQSNGPTLRSLANFHIELEQFCCSLRAHVFFVSRRIASRIHEISDLKKSSRAQSEGRIHEVERSKKIY